MPDAMNVVDLALREDKKLEDKITKGADARVSWHRS
jgi:hypothetical protein